MNKNVMKCTEKQKEEFESMQEINVSEGINYME